MKLETIVHVAQDLEAHQELAEGREKKSTETEKATVFKGARLESLRTAAEMVVGQHSDALLNETREIKSQFDSKRDGNPEEKVPKWNSVMDQL